MGSNDYGERTEPVRESTTVYMERIIERFGGLIGGRGIGEEGVKTLHEAGLELVYVYGSRSGLYNRDGSEASFSVGERPQTKDKERRRSRMLGADQLDVIVEGNEVVVCATVGSAGDPYYNQGYFVGSREKCLDFIEKLPLTDAERREYYTEQVQRFLRNRPQPVIDDVARELYHDVDRAARYMADKTKGESAFGGNDFPNEVSRIMWANQFAVDIARLFALVATDVTPFIKEWSDASGVFDRNESLPDFKRDLETLRDVFPVDDVLEALGKLIKKEISYTDYVKLVTSKMKPKQMEDVSNAFKY